MSEPQNGRIGGGVLKDNLERQGVNLNFKNTCFNAIKNASKSAKSLFSQ